MEAAGNAAASRAAVSRPTPSSSDPSRQEWRIVSDQPELERSELGKSNERLIYEVQQGREQIDVEFCSITIDGGLDNDILQQRLRAVAGQREQLQRMEIELQTQVIARSEIMKLQSNFDAQIKEYSNANIKLQEKLLEKEKKIHELERKMEEKERELYAIRLDTEAQVWAKEDLLREQGEELQSYRRERDNSEAEKAQHIKQIHDLQENIQEKEQQLMELQEQQRVAQETISFRDEQLKEAQAWMTRAQEIDALHSTTNHGLQAELRERTEQYSQLWFACQTQFGEIERLHMHIQQLQLELSDVREKSGNNKDGSHISQTTSENVSHVENNNSSELEVNGNGTPSGNSESLENENAGGASSMPSSTSSQADQVHNIVFAPSSLVGMTSYLPPGPVAAVHPFLLHQPGLHPVPSHATQSHFQPLPAMSSLQNWPNQQAVSDGQQLPIPDGHWQSEQNILRTDSDYHYESSANGQVILSNHLDANISERVEPDPIAPSPNEEVFESLGESFQAGTEPQRSLQEISSEFHDTLRLDALQKNNARKEENANPITDHGTLDPPNSSIQSSLSEAPNHSVNTASKMNSTLGADLPDAFVSEGPKDTYVAGRHVESSLLDEKSLLACIVRTIGSGSRIRISSTLPNRLGKMLAPLHWHDYKRKYGRLDEFIASHPELFVIEGDYIQLREGAQGIIAATAAAAKVAAAAPSYSSLLPSLAVTPMAQASRLKKPVCTAANSSFSAIQNQNINGGFASVAGGVSNVRILSKPRDSFELNGSETKTGRTVALAVNNGTNTGKTDFTQSRVAPLRSSAGFPGKPQARPTRAASSPRR